MKKKLSPQQKIKRQEKVVLWLYRCGYIDICNNKMMPDNLKTASLFTARQWQLAMKFKMRFFKKWRADVIEFMREVEGDEIISEAFRYDELFEKHFHYGEDGPPAVTLDDAYAYTETKSIEFAVWAERNNIKVCSLDEYETKAVYKRYLRERSKRQDQKF